MSKVAYEWFIEGSTGDIVRDFRINQTLFHDPAGKRFASPLEAFDALDDFCERTGIQMDQLNVTKELTA